jgi:alpha,alpha-trehalase
VKSINDRPGILSLALRQTVDQNGQPKIRGLPFVVPGGRFNEMYNWDSYFESLGLLADGRVHLAKSMAENFFYEIRHYGKLLNANRSYYLTRTQPPFLTDMVLQIFHRLPLEQTRQNLDWLAGGICSAIKEYWNVWMSEPRFVPRYGLSRFHGEGIGMPPETEPAHFDAVLKPYADRTGLSIAEYSRRYNDRLISEPELDRYFIHDRAVRESGHDTTYRLEGKCASIIPFELNCLLYKYEMDIGSSIKNIFGDCFINADGRRETSAAWLERAEQRKQRLNDLCWNASAGLYFDFDIDEGRQSDYESVTNFHGLWAGIVPQDRAGILV